jgi:ribonuclease PH
MKHTVTINSHSDGSVYVTMGARSYKCYVQDIIERSHAGFPKTTIDLRMTGIEEL